MGRQHRQDFDYAFHHVMNRAGARRWVFSGAEHRNAFIKTLEHIVRVDEIQIHAYCLMGNHYHLLVRTPLGNLSQAMQRLGSMFTKRFSRIEKVDGPLFRGRFKSIIVGHDDYLRQLSADTSIAIQLPQALLSPRKNISGQATGLTLALRTFQNG